MPKCVFTLMCKEPKHIFHPVLLTKVVKYYTFTDKKTLDNVGILAQSLNMQIAIP